MDTTSYPPPPPPSSAAGHGSGEEESSPQLHMLITYGHSLEPTRTSGVEHPHTSANHFAHYYGRDLYLLLSIITKMVPPELSHFHFYTRTFPHDRLCSELQIGGRGMDEMERGEAVPGTKYLDTTSSEYPILKNGLRKLGPKLMDDTYIRDNGPLYVRISPDEVSGDYDDPNPTVRWDSRDRAFCKMYHLLRVLYLTFIEHEGSTIRQLIDRGISECMSILSPLKENGEFPHEDRHDPRNTPIPKLKLPEGLEKEQEKRFSKYVYDQINYYFAREQQEMVVPSSKANENSVASRPMQVQRKRRTAYNRYNQLAPRIGGANLMGKQFDIEVAQEGITQGLDLPEQPTYTGGKGGRR
jgi:hypothetical protein